MDTLIEPLDYVELRCRTHYSFLRGASHPHELIDRAHELGLRGLAITDRDGVYGMPKAYLAAREKGLCGGNSKFLIVGSELAIDGGSLYADRSENLESSHSKKAQLQQKKVRLFLLAKNIQGYGVMCRLLSASHKGREKGDAAIQWSEFQSIVQEFGSQGLVAMPGEESESDQALLLDYYGNIKDIFKKDLYFSLSRHLDGWDDRATERALKLSKRFDVPIVATNDVHFHIREKKRLQDVLTSIRETIPLKDLGTRLFSNGERYLKSPQEMSDLFKDMPEALKRTLEIAEQCTFCPSELKYQYPSEWIPEGKTAQGYLEEMTWKKAREDRYPVSLYPDGLPEKVIQQIKHELVLIEKMRFADYFLTIEDIVRYARSIDILCQGRGSAANSVVCYCLGITAVSPGMIDVLFERFISEERAEPPDIDVDFEHERREEVIQYIYNKYGRDRAGMVANVICYRSKSSLREVSKAFGISPEEAESHPQASVLIEEIKDLPRHLGIHSGGFTLSAIPIIEIVPIESARMKDRTIVQWDKNDLAILGLLKVDVLALGMLTAIQKAFVLVNQNPKTAKPLECQITGKKLELSTIPKEDEKTYEMIRRGETVGVFQIESRAQMGMLRRLLPEKFYDLVVQVAIVRPGPIVGKMVHPYLYRRKNPQIKPDYPHPDLIPILEKTLGVPIFQEQVMKMAIVLADFTPGEADELRRAINAWKSKGSIEKMGLKLKNGLLSKGLPLEFVERIFQQIQGFAEYGFPESHAASFALLAYSSSYLKCHYPAEFTCALMNSQPMGFYSNHTLLEEAKRAGVGILPVDLNHSRWDSELIEGNSPDSDSLNTKKIRVGFRVVRGLGEDAVEHLMETRKKSRFISLIDFLSRTHLSPQALYSLAMGDAFVEFGLNQRESLWEILSYRTLTRPSSENGDSQNQMNLFEGRANIAEVNSHRMLTAVQTLGLSSDLNGEDRASFPILNDYQAIRTDYQVFGLSVRGHPMKELRKYFSKKIPSITSGEVKRAKVAQIVKIAGLIIVRQRPPNAKGTCFGTLEDEDGFLDLILHNDVFEKYREIFVNEPFIIATGKVQRELESTSMLVTKIEAVNEPEAHVMIHPKNFH